MRPLFLSERYLLESCKHNFSREILDNTQVVDEYFGPPLHPKSIWFNIDFVIYFQKSSPLGGRSSCRPVLPYTIGAELCCMVDAKSLPWNMQLIGGEAFGMKNFRQELLDLRDALKSVGPIGFDPFGFNGGVCRLIVTDANAVCFLRSSRNEYTNLATLPFERVTARDLVLDLRVTDSGDWLVDGVLEREPRTRASELVRVVDS